jgi:hypothetical protein
MIRTDRSFFISLSLMARCVAGSFFLFFTICYAQQQQQTAEEKIAAMVAAGDLKALAIYSQELVDLARGKNDIIRQQDVLINKYQQEHDSMTKDLQSAQEGVKLALGQLADLSLYLQQEREARDKVLDRIARIEKFGARRGIEAFLMGSASGGAAFKSAGAALGVGVGVVLIDWILSRK